MMSRLLESAVSTHYDRPGLIDAIRKGLLAAGIDPDNPSPEDLAPVDEFHTAGRLATIEALSMMPLDAEMHVLDAGSGLGGTARHLTAEHGCRVSGIDLTPGYVAVATALTEMTGLTAACDFRVGSVLHLPFDAETFDGAVSFHVAMNIADRERFYGEVARVLKPGAAFCIFDVMKGPGDGLAFPMPWAETPQTSFLKRPEETRALLEETGFRVVTEKSLHGFALDFFRDLLGKPPEGDPPPLGLHLLTGMATPAKFGNYAAGLEAEAIDPVIMVAERT